MSLQQRPEGSAGAGEEPLIRPMDPRRDREAVVGCVAGLQDFERTLEPTLPPGGQIARRYVDAMLQRCAAYRGRVFVAEGADGIVGFVCVLARIPETPPDETSRPHAAVGELYVEPDRRGEGIARRLLARAETHAVERGAERLRVQVLAANVRARRLYGDFGFHDRLVELEKPLPAPDAD